MLIKVGLLVLIIGLTGCASTYKIHANEPSAELSVTTTIDGNASSTSRRTYILALADGSCDHNSNGDSIGHDNEIGTPTSLNIDPTPIAATGWLHFNVGYAEHRFEEDLDCKVDGSFEPVAGKKYKGTLRIKNNVHSCDFTITDASSGENIPIEKSQYACPYVGYTGEHGFMQLNGVGRDRGQIPSVPHVIVVPAPVHK